mmetsp:Transcript_6361/g.15721  ORF Transcript_6361/g.15721 Transcript_6361/m.15721 type:complete len:514 (+) Transcript_6361:86-1627(+)
MSGPALLRNAAAAFAVAAAVAAGSPIGSGGHAALRPDVHTETVPRLLEVAQLQTSVETQLEATAASNLSAAAPWSGAQAGSQVTELWQRFEAAAAQLEGSALSHLAAAEKRLHSGGDGHGHGHDDKKDKDDDIDIYPDHYKLVRAEDTVSWVVFFVLFFLLLFFDNFFLHTGDERPSFGRASLYTLFWLLCAGAFNIYVYFARGPEDAFSWGTGYLLEWMLSVDNLFVFRSIFVAFGTPDEQKHKPLFWGIVGAIIFRMIFFVIEEVLLHSFAFMHYVLGIFLVYTGIKICVMDEDEEVAPQDHFLIRKITEWLPFVNAYAPTPKFFARIPHRCDSSSPRRESLLDDQGRHSLKATRLLLVVVCLELTDIVFAVDSVSAIVAQIPDLFLAYTACVFAMLGLRATFFVVDELVKLFSLLSYAVAAILIFIGIKLCLRGWVHIEASVVCLILVSTLALSMIASVLWDRFGPEKAEDKAEEGENEEGTAAASKHERPTSSPERGDPEVATGQAARA